MSSTRPATGLNSLRHGCRVPLLGLALFATATALRAQPASPIEVPGESVRLSSSYRYFDGIAVESVVFTANSIEMITDTLGAWTPYGEGTTSTGFVLRHRKFSRVFVTLAPFAGAGPAKGADDWRGYRWEVAARLGPETLIKDLGESGTAGGVPSFASWITREATFLRPSAGTTEVRFERHVAASAGSRGILIVLAGPAAETERVEQDFRFLLARLERRDPVETASHP